MLGVGVDENAATGAGESLTILLKRATSQGDSSQTSTGSGGSTSWKPGDAINKPTADGYPSWSVVRSRYWQNRALNAAPGEFSQANLDRMQQGLAPLHDQFGVPMELHHINGRSSLDPHNINNLREVWPWEHDDIDPYRYYDGPRPQ